MRNWWPLAIAVVAATWLAYVAATPPAPRSTSFTPLAFSAERAMTDVREIARSPHPTGSADNARVRLWLIDRLNGLGASVQVRSTTMSPRGAKELRRWSGDATPRPVETIIATLSGLDRSKPAVMLMAHYDSVWGSPGAADDGAGVASALETVRALRATGPFGRDLMVVFTDGEELGMEGATAFFASAPESRRVGVIVNLEARGGGGRTAMFETESDNGAMMRLFAQAVRHPSATSMSVLVYKLLPNNTDFTPAKTLGIPGFNFAFIGRPSLYHSPLATADRLDQGALQDMGDQALDLVRALLATPVLPARAPDLVFFDAFGLLTVAYSAAIGWAVIGGAVLLYGVAAWRGGVSLGALARGGLATLALLLLAGLMLFVGNLLSGADGKTNYYDRLAAIPRLEVQALLIGLAATAFVVAAFRSREEPAAGPAIGAAIPLLLLGIGLQIIAPTADFVLAWPLLISAAAQAIWATLGSRAGVGAAIVATALVGGYLLAMSLFLMEGVGPNIPSAVALPLALIVATAWPLIPRVRVRRKAIAGAILLILAIGIAVSVRLDPMSPSVPLYSLARN